MTASDRGLLYLDVDFGDVSAYCDIVRDFSDTLVSEINRRDTLGPNIGQRVAYSSSCEWPDIIRLSSLHSEAPERLVVLQQRLQHEQSWEHSLPQPTSQIVTEQSARPDNDMIEQGEART